jgi:hypothetical protein
MTNVILVAPGLGYPEPHIRLLDPCVHKAPAVHLCGRFLVPGICSIFVAMVVSAATHGGGADEAI